MIKKVAVVTSTRAEYGLLSHLMRTIQLDQDLQLQVIVTGMHLSPEFGLTYQFIEADGFDIDAKVEMLLSSDTPVGITKSMGICLISLSETLHRLAPDILVLLGDRYETLAVAQCAMIQKIPIAHIHGGELSAGAIDDSIRHAITKLSHLHFVAAEPYRHRVIQLGEHPERVMNVGAPGLERIANMTLLSRSELEKEINLQLKSPLFLITYHPATLAIKECQEILDNLLSSLSAFPNATLIFTLANADESGRKINHTIETFVQQNANRAKAYKSLGDLNYISLLSIADCVIGNSSSGILEAPYFKTVSVNIGSRQDNRLKASTIIDCDGFGNSIITAITRGLSSDFQATLNNPTLYYLKDQTAKKIINVIKNSKGEQLLMKTFYDMSLS